VSSAHIELLREGPATPWLGQLVVVHVDVWRPQGVTPLEPFSLDDVVAAGMIAKWSVQAPPPDEKDEGDTHFLVQHRTLLVFPQTDGELALPVLVARWTDPVTKAPAVAQSSTLRFTAAVPKGAADTLPLVAGSVAFTQAFDRDLSGLRVGDGFTRTLTLRATDTDPIVFPELSVPEVAGLTAYPAGARAAGGGERGRISGTETLRITYVIERVGPHRVAGQSIRWLEPSSGRYSEASVPDFTLWAAPNPSLGFQCLGTARGSALATAFGTFAMLALLTLGIVRRVRRGPGGWERALAQRSRERRAFREVLREARHGSSLMLLQKMYAWLIVRFPGSLDRTLAPLERATPEAKSACVRLEGELFREMKSVGRPSAFVFMLRRARNAMGRLRRRVVVSELNSARADQGGTR
jgi:hypothetical protein